MSSDIEWRVPQLSKKLAKIKESGAGWCSAGKLTAVTWVIGRYLAVAGRLDG